MKKLWEIFECVEEMYKIISPFILWGCFLIVVNVEKIVSGKLDYNLGINLLRFFAVICLVVTINRFKNFYKEVKDED